MQHFTTGLICAILATTAVWTAGCGADLDRRASLALDRVGQQAVTTGEPEEPDATAAMPSGDKPAPQLGPDATLRDFLVYAAVENPGLEAAWYRWQAALERPAQVTALPEPVVTYRYYIRKVETRVGPQRQGLGAAQAIPWPGKLAGRGRVATEEAKVARRHYEALKYDLFYRVRQAYYELAYLDRAVALVRENRDLMKYLERVARSRYKAAATKHPDVIRAQVELGHLTDRLASLDELRGPAAADLNAVLGRPEDAPLPPVSLGTERRLAADDDRILAWLRDESPVLEVAEAEIDKADEAIDLARQEYYPDLALGLDWIQTDDALNPATPDSGKDPVIGRVSVAVPVWREKYAAAVREAERRRMAAARNRSDQANKLAARGKMALYRFHDAGRKIDLFRDTLVPKAEQSLKATEASFRAGESNFFDLVDAERVLLAFQLEHQKALRNQGVALADLERLVGRDLTADQVAPVTDGPADSVKNQPEPVAAEAADAGADNE